MNETAINYFLVELDRMLKNLEFFSKQQGISLGAAKRANEIHKEIIELIRPFSTDKLSVEKLQEHLLPYKKETVQKIIDEKMQLVTADEFLKLHKESLTAIRENGKLQEKLNTAKKALTEIAYGEYNTFKLSAVPIAKQALAAIGNEGSGDE